MVSPLTDAEFSASVLKSAVPVFLDFWAPWCGPCRAMLPVIDELARQYEGKVKFFKMNVEENIETPGKFGVMSIPTLVIFKDGEAVDTFIGVQSKETLTAKIDALLK